tara:strand:+ start:991 stop:3528 length:2538 start_codon:yes stop_codon:yes gene_type:complete
MAIDKALYQAPQGIEQIAEEEEPIEITVEDPEALSISGPGFEIDMVEEEDEDKFNENLAETMEESELLKLSGELVGEYEADVASRKEWIQTYVDGLELLGMKTEDRTEPWDGACGVYHPILAEAVVKFQAETMMETFPAAGPVKTQIIGKETAEIKKAAERVRDDMNYQLTEVMVEYRPEHERMLWGLGLAGNAFKKVYVDVKLDRQTSIYVPAEDVVVPYGASSLESAERVTHVMRKSANEVRRLQHEGFYRDIELGDPSSVLDEIEKKIAEKLGFRATQDDRFRLLEMQVELDLAGDEHTDEKGKPTGIARPYIVTIEKGTGLVLAIRRNWRPEDDTAQKRNHFVHYPYIPGFGFYAFGLIHLIGAFAKSGTSILRQLVDAGTLSNLPGGFKTRGLRTKGDDTPISPGEFRDVDVPSGTMRDNIMPLPYKEPSQVLAALLNQIIDEGRKFAGSMDLQTSDMSANAPVGTTLAILERSLKTMSAVQARIHYAMRQEFKLLKEIIRDYAPKEYSYEPEEGDRTARQADYDLVDVIPVSDPNAATMAQKVVQYQAALQLAQTAPQLYDLPVLHRQMLEVLGIKNYQKLVPVEDDMKPRDPVTENMNMLKGKPVKAFLYQDHKAHITVHMAMAQDPLVQELLGQNPQMMQKLMAVGSAHIAEHLGMEMRKQMEQAMGQTLPAYEDDEDEQMMSPEMEVRVSQMAAQAAQQLLQQHQQEAQQQKNQQAQQDPLIQLQQQELQIKSQDLQRKVAKDQSDAMLKQQQLQVERERIEAQQESKGAELAVRAQSERAQREAQQEQQGFSSAADMYRHRTQLDHQAELERLRQAQAARQAQKQAKQPAKKKGE